MASTTGSRLVARALKQQGAEALFFLTGGPMVRFTMAAAFEELKLVDVRHEQAAAMAAHAWGRVRGKPGLCSAASGPGVTNLTTGVATAFADAAPLVVLGGSSAESQSELEAFQEMDQVEMMKPITKWSRRVHDAKRIPEYIHMAFQHARGNRPGPVYVDLPGDVLHQRLEEGDVYFPPQAPPLPRPQGNPGLVSQAINMLADAQRPVVITGSGALWSDAAEDLREFVDTTGIPFYTTPQGRGIIPEDHPLCFPGARSLAFREADVMLVIGTRFNVILSFGRAPRFAPDAQVIQVDIDAEYIGHNRPVDLGIVGDAKMVLQQLTQEARGKLRGWGSSPWVDKLRQDNARRWAKLQPELISDHMPITTMRLCKEVADFLDRDAILAVDGHVTLNWGRQIIPTHSPRHRLNCGPFGCIGVGVPFGLGAKVARPDLQVLTLSGDGGFGMNAMEMDTAVRNNIPLVVVVNNNASWETLVEGKKVPGQYLGHQRYDKMAEAFGCHGEQVERPQDIRPALERAFKAGVPALVNVITDPYTDVQTQEFYGY